jgi:hypothetical protein
MKITINIVIILFLQLLGLNSKVSNSGKFDVKEVDNHYTYLVEHTSETPSFKTEWENKQWKNVKPVSLKNYMGEKPSHFPETSVKLKYDNDNIYVIFKVLDKYVKAVETKTNGKICLDSCVEFFFSPGPDTDRGYFNFEANCKGVFLFEYHTDGGKINGFVKPEDCGQVKIVHSLERNVEQEISEPLEWCVEYSIPLTVLKKYMKIDNPGSGVTWRANFYKCADKTSHPHWLTWARVDYPRPKFHLPEFFGKLVFD